MLVAIIIAHLPALWKKAPAPKRYRNTLISILLSLALVAAGVSLLQPNRWLSVVGLF
jgi:hypothetical protein